MKPFLKWAGGKRRLVPQIEAALGQGGSRFIEPFVGGGSVFLGMARHFDAYVLADNNPDLIVLYDEIKAHGMDFIESCRDEMFLPEFNAADIYYRLRDEFNRLDKSASDRRSKLFVYLNRHGFNGLCRYGRSGFNVPFGRKASIYFPGAEMAAFAEKARRSQFRHADFRLLMAEAGAGDTVYCDPPYIPLSTSSNFNRYAPGGFSSDDHRDLADACFAAAARGAHVVLSNADLETSRNLYAGAQIQELSTMRSIGGGNSVRTAREILAVFAPATARDQVATSGVLLAA